MRDDMMIESLPRRKKYAHRDTDRESSVSYERVRACVFASLKNDEVRRVFSPTFNYISNKSHKRERDSNKRASARASTNSSLIQA